MKCPNEHLLVRPHHLECSVVKLGEVFLQRFIMSLAHVEEVGGGHFAMLY